MAYPGHICIPHLGNAIRKILRSIPEEYSMRLSYRIDVDADGERCILMVSALGSIQAEAELVLAGEDRYGDLVSRSVWDALLPILRDAQRLRQDAGARIRLVEAER